MCVVSWCDCVCELWEGEICGIGVKLNVKNVAGEICDEFNRYLAAFRLLDTILQHGI